MTTVAIAQPSETYDILVTRQRALIDYCLRTAETHTATGNQRVIAAANASDPVRRDLYQDEGARLLRLADAYRIAAHEIEEMTLLEFRRAYP